MGTIRQKNSMKYIYRKITDQGNYTHEALFKREEHAQLHTHWNRTPTKLSKDRKVAQGSGPGLWHRARHRAQEPGLRAWALGRSWPSAGPSRERFHNFMAQRGSSRANR